MVLVASRLQRSSERLLEVLHRSGTDKISSLPAFAGLPPNFDVVTATKGKASIAMAQP